MGLRAPCPCVSLQERSSHAPWSAAHMPTGAGVQGRWCSWIQGREGVRDSSSGLPLALLVAGYALYLSEPKCPPSPGGPAVLPIMSSWKMIK